MTMLFKVRGALANCILTVFRSSLLQEMSRKYSRKGNGIRDIGVNDDDRRGKYGNDVDLFFSSFPLLTATHHHMRTKNETTSSA